MTNIEWTDKTLNVTAGCTLVSEGCKNCYAKTMHKRLNKMYEVEFALLQDVKSGKKEISKRELLLLEHRVNINKYKKPFSEFVQHDSSEGLYKVFDPIWNRHKPTMWFVNSMSDLFHEKADFHWIFICLSQFAGNQPHIFQILTKRPERILEFEKFQYSLTENLSMKGFQVTMERNLWFGTSVENQKWADIRIPQLLKNSAQTKFLSCEPLLERIDIEKYLHGIDLVIVGGESGAKSKIRPFDIDWARDLRDQCKRTNTKFFYKQSGTLQPCETQLHIARKECKGKGCVYLDGVRYNEMPEPKPMPDRRKIK